MQHMALYGILHILVLGAFFSRCDGKPGYVFTAPKTLQKGSNETFCFNFHALSESIDVKVRLVENVTVHSEADHIFYDGVGGCFPFHVPAVLGRRSWDHEIEVMGKSASLSYVFHSRTSFIIKEPLSYVILLQTDKPMYKPSQTIRFRLLALDINLKPVPLPISKEKDSVVLEDPRGVRYMQWTDLYSSSGLLTREYQLNDDPQLGTWSLKASIGGATHNIPVAVDEYVLPKYEVTVTTPSFVTPFSPVIPIKVCARYTYGKAVKGSLAMNVCLKYTRRYYYRNSQPTTHACDTRYTEIDGCMELLIEGSELGLPYSNYTIWTARIFVDATITETATGVAITKTAEISQIKRTELQLDFVSTEKFYKPGLPFSGKVRVTRMDGKPTPGEPIRVSTGDGLLNETYTSDYNGVVSFTLPKMMKVAKEIYVEAIALRYQVDSNRWSEQYQPMETPIQSHRIVPWFSPSRSYLRVSPPTSTPLECGAPFEVKLMYTTVPGSTVTFYHQVTTRGHIVDEGRRTHYFSGNDAVIDWGAYDALDGTTTTTMTPPLEPPPPRPRNRWEPWHAGFVPQVETYKRPQDRLSEINDAIQLKEKERLSKYRRSTHVAEFTFSLDIRPLYSPKSKLLVYFVNEGEIIADYLPLDIDPCFSNDVSMEFSSDRVPPGGDVSVLLTADPNSVCSIGVLDKSVLLLGGDNQVTAEKVFKMAATNDVSNQHFYRWRSVREHCVNLYGKFEQSEGFEAISYYADSSRAFRDLNLVTVSDLDVETKPCHYVFRMYAVPLFSGVDRESNRGRSMTELKEGSRVRSNFPETWLWQIEEVGPSGSVELRETAPDTITEWVGNALCANKQSGFGISPKRSVTVFKDLFVSFTVPYSVIRGEHVPVVVTVFNYLTTCVTIVFEIAESRKYDLIGAMSEMACVCGRESYTHEVVLVGRDIGQINIRASVKSTNEFNMCGSRESAHTIASDTMVKSLLVEPEGLPMERSSGSYICPQDEEGGTYRRNEFINLPTTIIPGSARAYISIIGNVMGASLEGLGSLVRLPSGCGEQTASSLAPNIYVMQYLASTNKLTSEMNTKLINNMKHGHQRMLGFKTKSGGFSVWTNGDPSMWLTLFTVKSFANAADYIFVDKGDLQMAINWVTSEQRADGCLPVMGHQHGRGWTKDASVSLTAYAIVAMLEAGYDKDSDVILSALKCLSRVDAPDAYTAALVAYAYSLYDATSNESLSALAYLQGIAINSDGLTHWERAGISSSTYYRYSSAEVEMTAYALLALLSQPTNRFNVLSVVRWISKQRNAYGGFSSTQDTVVALQALARYASQLSFVDVNLHASITYPTQTVQFSVTDKSELVLQTAAITTPLPTALDVLATGEGCALLQIDLRYNIPGERRMEPAFQLTVETTTPGDSCTTRQIKACTRFLGVARASGMAIMELTMVTGWMPDEQSVAMHLKNVMLKVMKYEITESNSVVFYFDSVQKFDHCVQFTVNEVLQVNNTQPARIKIYDYYNTEQRVEQTYNLGDCEPFIWRPVPPREPFPFFVEDVPLPPFEEAPESNMTLPPMSEDLLVSMPPSPEAKPANIPGQPSPDSNSTTLPEAYDVPETMMMETLPSVNGDVPQDGQQGEAVTYIRTTPPTIPPANIYPHDFYTTSGVAEGDTSDKNRMTTVGMKTKGAVVPEATVDAEESARDGVTMSMPEMISHVMVADQMVTDQQTAKTRVIAKEGNTDSTGGASTMKIVGTGGTATTQDAGTDGLTGDFTTPGNIYPHDFYTTPRSITPCPMCINSTLLIDLKAAFCRSSYAYKTVIVNGEFYLKIQANLRPSTKQVIGTFANYTLDTACPCSTITSSSKVIILSAHKLSGHNLLLDGQTVVIKYMKGLDRILRRYSVMADCISNVL